MEIDTSIIYIKFEKNTYGTVYGRYVIPQNDTQLALQ